jgi:hypothetical protein
MNYIHLINRFWQCHRENRFTSSAITLYFYLLDTCNRSHWTFPIRHSDRYIAFDVDMSVNTVRKAKNLLKQRGLIDFKSNPKGGRGIENSTSYTLNVAKIDTYSDTFSDTFSDTYSDTFSGDTIKHKHKRKHKEDANASPTKRTVSRKEIELSESAQKFADWFRGLLPPDRDTTDSDLRAWAKTYDELVTIDKREKAEIKAVVLWARQDSFWKSNFLSATKLRHKDKTGTKYYDVFLNKMKAEHDANTSTNGGGANGQNLTAYQQRQHNGQRSVTTLVENARDFAASLT